MSAHRPDVIQTVFGPLRLDLAVLGLEGGCQLTALSPHAWGVSSSTPGHPRHLVTRDPGDLFYRCDCEAGSHDRECRHTALVLLVEATGAVPAIHPGTPLR